jgi:hypothetical protein
MAEITIATSLVPRNFKLQRVAIDSWLNLGFKVISLNSAEEAAIVTQNFPDIPVKIVNRTAASTTGKPYVYFDDVCKALIDEQSRICGIVNSDIFLSADAGFVDFISTTVGDGLLFGSRIDVDAMTDLDGEKFIYGFDFFFFDRQGLEKFPKSDFCLGVPWWDYWAPFVPIVKGYSCKELISPVAFHARHETKWAGELFIDCGKKFADKISQFVLNTDFAGKITDLNSPEQLTAFSFDVLQYILMSSEKVVYPQSANRGMLIEVGQSQYLAMREQVIEHHKKTVVLQEQLNIKNAQLLSERSEVEALHSSLSWRITKPLRWLGDRIRATLGQGGRR